MAINIDSQDLENFPGITKRVTVELDSIVPINNEGDETFVLNTTTRGYSNNDDRTAIPDLYLTNMKGGWIKSSGFAGSSGKFSLDPTHKNLDIKMDATVSGSAGGGYYTITLTPNDDLTPVPGEVVAAEIEVKIRALVASLETVDVGFAAAYRNASVEYKNSKFHIISGSIGNYYTGSLRSSVAVRASSSNSCLKELGFDLPISSHVLANTAVKETLLNTSYTADTDTLNVNTGTGAVAGNAFLITDGLNEDYFTALSGTTDSSIKVATNSVNAFTGITNSYIGGEARIQLVKEQDPESIPNSWYTSIDQLVRYGIKSMINQIDYSS